MPEHRRHGQDGWDALANRASIQLCLILPQQYQEIVSTSIPPIRRCCVARLEISLLGSFRVSLDGEPITDFESDKVRALLAYLAVECDRPHRRETLVGLLWPDQEERRARHNLSQALSSLRATIRERYASQPLLLATRQTIRLERGEDCWLDAHALLDHLAACETHDHGPRLRCDACLSHLEQIRSLYAGDLLEGFTLPGGAAFEAWCLLVREALRRDACRALNLLYQQYRARGQWEQAIACARHHLSVDPWHEGAHRQLLFALAIAGEPIAALAQYETCRRMLREELGVAPASATTRLWRWVRDAGAPVAGPTRPEPGAGTAQTGLLRPGQPAFVAREDELSQLDQALATASAGHGQVTWLTGEAGTGKTTLLAEFARRAEARDPTLMVLTGSCNAYAGGGDPYLPFREMLRQLVGDPGTAAMGPSAERARRIQQLHPLLVRLLTTRARGLIGTLLPEASIEALRTINGADADIMNALNERPTRAAAPSLRQRDLISQVMALFASLAETVPLLLVLDDLQWVDEGSIELLLHLARNLSERRIHVVGAYRPSDALLREDQSPLPLTLAVHELGRTASNERIHLSESPGRAFVDALIDSEPNRIPSEIRQAISRRTRGHALFTVELLRDLREHGSLVQDGGGIWEVGAPFNGTGLPTRIEATIAGRVDRLSPALRRVLNAASVEGEVFTLQVVARAIGAEAGEVLVQVSDALGRRHHLVAAEGVRTLPAVSLATYRFRHALYQAYLYADLDEGERAYLHERVALALEALYDGQGDEVAVSLANHFQRAGRPNKALSYLQMAANRAIRLSAPREAIRLARNALDMIDALPMGAERNRREMALQLALATALAALEGDGSAEAGVAYERAYQLGLRLARDETRFAATWGLCRWHWVRAELDEALSLAYECLDLAERLDRWSLRHEAHIAVASTLRWQGALPASLAHWERACALYDRARQGGYALSQGHEQGVVCLASMAQTLWHLGYPDQALRRAQEAVALAREADHAATLAYALIHAGGIHQMRREPGLALPLLEEGIARSKEQGFAQWLVIGTVLKGWCAVQTGGGASHLEGMPRIKEMRSGIEATMRTGCLISCLRYMGLLADALKTCGQVEAGLAVLDEAFQLLDRSGERIQVAELHRLRGELLLMGGEPGGERCLRQAVEMARGQSNRSLELRAAVSLARVLAERGRRAEAAEVLAPVYGWFEEGFGTADWVEAREMLSALDSSRDVGALGMASP